MSTKIFNGLFCKNMRHPKHFHLYPSHRTPEKNVLFTKFGDRGKSKVYFGELYKDHLIFEAIGVTEELNSFIGLAREFVREDEKLIPVADKLRKIQLVLVDVIDIISSLQPNGATVEKRKPVKPQTTAKVTNKDVEALELFITHYGSLLPPPERAIIPGGGKASALLNVAMNVCRRCERILVHIFKDHDHEYNIIKYINRLSSYLCQAARVATKFANRTEAVYRPQRIEHASANNNNTPSSTATSTATTANSPPTKSDTT